MEQRLDFLVGPTACGKSAVAIELAERAGVEIVSLDSMLVYRGMDVGVAKPDARELARAPHHAIDLVAPSEPFSVSDWLREARQALARIEARGKRALFVGGTAFYLKAMLQGLFEGPAVDPQVRARLEERYAREGPAALHDELRRVDPRLAARLHPNDRKRVIRGLEVFEQTGRALSEWQQTWGWHGAPAANAPPARLIGLSLDVARLDARIARRVTRMLDGGWVEEARTVRAGCGFGPTASAALGYAEVLDYADGRIDRAACEERIVLGTRQFARKQRTWLRKFESIEWIDAPPLDGEASAGLERKDLASVAGEVLDRLGWR